MKKAYLTNKTEYQVNTIFCLGLNYMNHISEMNHTFPTQPVFFIKPNTAISYQNEVIHIPSICKNFHYEAEITLLISKDCKNVSEIEALDFIAGYGIGIDFTMRDQQEKAKAKGLPWTLSKSFDKSAMLSDFIPFDKPELLENLSFSLKQNGITKQTGNSRDMIFKPGKIIAYLSQFFTLQAGDVIFTGTPEGVGTLSPGDHLELFLNENLAI